MNWRERMEKLKDARGNCVSTYVPWLIHVEEEGKILFGDSSERDLAGFLETAKEAGLMVIFKPGPYLYSELENAGLPRWLLTNYPQIMARTAKGDPIGPMAVSYASAVSRESAALLPRVCAARAPIP